MRGIIFPYDQAVSLEDIPELQIEDFRNEALDLISENWRILAYFALPLRSGQPEAGLCMLLANEDNLLAMRAPALDSFPALTPECPQAHLFEREIYELHGIMPLRHPWLKPVRKTPDSRPGSLAHGADYGFYQVHGAQAHEVGVGPIHAGVIEPGHFRFQCYGENVLNLEIALGYQHRGIEQMLLKSGMHPDSQWRLRLVECVAGDASVAHATAHCVLLERLLAGQMPEPSAHAQRIRRIGLELERLACHCGDLGAMAGDTGFLPTSAWNGRIRGDFLNLTAAICGNRFGRGLLQPGGTGQELAPEECEIMAQKLRDAERDAIGSCHAMFASASVRDRFAETGMLRKTEAWTLGIVGVAARACGISLDARFQTPLADLPLYDTKPRLWESGDVMARARVRFMELRDSVNLVANDLRWLIEHPRKKNHPLPRQGKLPAAKLAVAQVESWRGEVCHVAVTGANGELLARKIIDPSFHNWIALALVMQNGQISDFPLCNKSFNLSYCGHDL